MSGSSVTPDAPRAAPLTTVIRTVVLLLRMPAYFLLLVQVFLEHHVPPHPWKWALASLAMIGLVAVLEMLYREATRARPAPAAWLNVLGARWLVSALGLVVVVVVAYAAAIGVTLSGMN